jgi:hypothetical protein
VKVRDITDARIARANLSTRVWSAAGEELGAGAEGLDSLAEFPGWSGTASDGMRHRISASSGRLRSASLAAGAAGDLLELHCGVLTTVQLAVVATVRTAEAAGMTVHDDGRVTAGRAGAAGTVAAVLSHVPAASGAVRSAEAALTAVLRAAMTTVSCLDTAFALQVHAVTSVEPGPDPAPAPVPVAPGTAGSWALSPDGVTDGVTDGVPEGVRVDPRLTGSVSPEVQEELLEVATAAAQELVLRGLDPGQTGVEVTTVGGAPGVVVGDITTADRITTLVSGTGSSDLGGLRDSAALAGRISAPGHATVAWHGYAAPGSLPEAALSGSARSGGTSLRGLQSTLREHSPQARLSVVGHSYGTRVIDEAAGDDIFALDADEIHLMGSPGMTAPTAGDLNLRATDGHAEVHVHKTPGDVIGLVADIPRIHGDDPADPDWGADSVNGVPPGQAPADRQWWETAMNLWGLTDLDVGDEHGSYCGDEKVLGALRGQ